MGRMQAVHFLRGVLLAVLVVNLVEVDFVEASVEASWSPGAVQEATPQKKEQGHLLDCKTAKLLKKKDHASKESCHAAIHMCGTDEAIQKNCVRTCACGGWQQVAAAKNKKQEAKAKEKKTKAAREKAKKKTAAAKKKELAAKAKEHKIKAARGEAKLKRERAAKAKAAAEKKLKAAHSERAKKAAAAKVAAAKAKEKSAKEKAREAK